MEEDKKLDSISVKVVGQDNTEVLFRIKRHTPLRKLMDAYAEKMGKRGIKFLLEGKRLSPDQTADEVGLENDDIIEVVLEQTGGL